ncbi:MAG TPA: hypothetical protein VFQ30_07765 [Ktedonobacteraceae bacterium]|nr:hypothetical protein [Ktedonobacteraceae bacterium]
MRQILQKILLVTGVLALVVLVIEIVLSVQATVPGSTPVRVVHVNAGPYPLTVSLYRDPANAGFALPFAIAPASSIHGSLAYDVASVPDQGMSATPVRASIGPDASVVNGVRGDAEITVQGQWFLRVLVHGPSGDGIVRVPITATAPPAMPLWSGWLIGLIPFYGLFIFLLLLPGREKKQDQLTPTQSQRPVTVP